MKPLPTPVKPLATPVKVLRCSCEATLLWRGYLLDPVKRRPTLASTTLKGATSGAPLGDAGGGCAPPTLTASAPASAPAATSDAIPWRSRWQPFSGDKGI